MDAVGADDVFGGDGLGAAGTVQAGLDAAGDGRQPGEGRLALRRGAELAEPFSQQVLGAVLRQVDHVRVGGAPLQDAEVDAEAVAVAGAQPEHVDAVPLGEDAVGDAEVGEVLERAGVQGGGLGQRLRGGVLVDQAETGAAPGQFTGEGQAGGSGPDDEDWRVMHGSPPIKNE